MADEVRLAIRSKSHEPNQDDALGNELLPKDQFAEVLVSGEQQCALLIGTLQHGFVLKTSLLFGDIPDLVPVRPQPQHE